MKITEQIILLKEELSLFTDYRFKRKCIGRLLAPLKLSAAFFYRGIIFASFLAKGKIHFLILILKMWQTGGC